MHTTPTKASVKRQIFSTFDSDSTEDEAEIEQATNEHPTSKKKKKNKKKKKERTIKNMKTAFLTLELFSHLIYTYLFDSAFKRFEKSENINIL